LDVERESGPEAQFTRDPETIIVFEFTESGASGCTGTRTDKDLVHANGIERTEQAYHIQFAPSLGPMAN
jgi:hypothetical protein